MAQPIADKLNEISLGQREANRALRWFLLLWLCLAYIWGMSGAVQKGIDITFVEDAIFTLLLAALGVLLWHGMVGNIAPRWQGGYFAGSGLLALAASVMTRQDTVALSLFCVLICSAMLLLRRITSIALVAAMYLLLLLLSTFVIALRLASLLNALVSSPKPFVILDKWSHSFLPGGVSSLPAEYGGICLFVVGFLFIYAQQMRSHAQLAAAHAQLQASTEQIAALTRLTERQRLARELHDTLAQGLAGLILQLQVAESYQTQEQYARTQEILQQAISRARTALLDARRAIDDLRLASPADNLMQSVRDEIDRFTAATGITCQAEIAALAQVPSPLREHTLRAIAEGLTNVTRHAHAHHAWVQARIVQDMLVLEVRDDGVGMAPMDETATTGHYGLLGLRERARLVGGRLEIDSAADVGTTLRLMLSLAAQEVADD